MKHFAFSLAFIMRLAANSEMAYFSNRSFSFTWPASIQIYWNKRKFYIRKEFNSHRIGLVHQHDRRFIVLVHQYGCRDVI